MYDINETSEIEKEGIIKLITSDDIEAQGEIFDLLNRELFCSRIRPPLALADVYPYLLKHLKRVILEDPNGKWSGSRYEAAAFLVNLFRSYWDQGAKQASAVADIKNLLEALLRDGSEEVRICIISGTLEHLFEDQKIKDYFSSWIELPRLNDAYSEASLFAKEILANRKRTEGGQQPD
jgi:hypothetical protein